MLSFFLLFVALSLQAARSYVDGRAAGRWIHGVVLLLAVGPTALLKSNCGRPLDRRPAVGLTAGRCANLPVALTAVRYIDGRPSALRPLADAQTLTKIRNVFE